MNILYEFSECLDVTGTVYACFYLCHKFNSPFPTTKGDDNKISKSEKNIYMSFCTHTCMQP